MKRIGILGEAMGELVTESARRMMVGIGGDTFNAAVYMAQLDVAVQPHFFSAIGTDPFSQLFLQQCEEYGVQSSGVQVDYDRSMGLYSITNDAYGERHFNYWRSDSAARHCLNQADHAGALAAWRGCDSLFLSGITLAIMEPSAREAVLQTLVNHTQGTTYFDDNYRPQLWGENAQRWYTEVFKASDCLLLSLEDQLAIHGFKGKEELLHWLADFPGKTIILRDGENPMTVIQDGQATELPVSPVAPKDTTAAGDSFSGTYIALSESGYTAEDAAKHAARVSAYVIQHSGALVQLPTALRQISQ